ncbi:phytoene desaturase family protein [Priestia koreensis]|uniref:phytoene desaturase family protein n=1 Tax=Priestia koreensis TaxID=284581 RepID=UPI0034595064
MKRVVIIGAGLGGLAAAVLLQKKGFSVTVVEKNEHPGGKMMPVKLGDYEFDFGPNTMTMPAVFNRVIEEAGERPEDYLEWIKLNHHTNNHFSDGTTFAMTTDREKMLTQFSQLDATAKQMYEKYLAEIERLYTISEQEFFYRTFTSWRDYLDPKLFRALTSVRPLQSMEAFHRHYFQNEQIRWAFNRYATYIGSSPYVSPATFSLIGHLEMTDGVYYVKGGNTNIAESFARIFQKLGGDLRLRTKVLSVDVEQKRAKGVKLDNGDALSADFVVMNGDLLSVYPELVAEEDRPHFSDQKIAQFEPSISAYVILAGTKTRNPNLIHHQVYFTDDYQNEFRELFDKRTYPTDPTIYVCNSSYTDRNRAPGDNLFILVNAPALTKENEEMGGNYKAVVYEKLKRFGIDVQADLVEEKVITPGEIKSLFSAYKGALYGVSSNRKIDSFLRPSNQSKDIKNVYFTGGTTHPGGGSPMVTISGMNVAKLIEECVK